MAHPKKKNDSGQNIIVNMGLFWRCDKVRWAGNRGIGPKRLIGKNCKHKKGPDVNFWEQSGIYALYNDYNLIYVGQTSKSRLGQRIKDHLTDDKAGRWNMFSWFGFQRVIANGGKLSQESKVKITSPVHLKNILEGIVIAIAEPLMNGQQGRFGSNVERYLQVDDTTENKQELDLQKILTKLSKLDKMQNQLLKLSKKN